MEEVFHENILLTFLFCFFVSMGIIQIMAARRGWHGLSIYGGRVRRNVNNAIGAGLIIFGYAWYFSNPLHRNVRNIEAFMSLVCLILGIAAAAAATAVLAALAEALKRRSRRVEESDARLERISLPQGTALISGVWGERGENLVLVAEPGRGSERLARSLYAAMPGEHGMLSLHIRPPVHGLPSPHAGEALERVTGLIERVARERGMDLEGEMLAGLGWGGNDVRALLLELEGYLRPRGVVLVAPVIPDCERGLVGDALLSNTPLDICADLCQRKPWREADFKRILSVWLPALALCVAASTAVTVGFDVRWQLLSGPAVGLVLSLWVSYFFLRRRNGLSAESLEGRLAARLCSPAPAGAGTALVMVLTPEGAACMAGMTAEVEPAVAPVRAVLWEDVLRGKFLLKGGTPRRLEALIWQGVPEDDGDDVR